MLKELVKLANHLDSKGLVKEADYLDRIIKSAGLWNKFKRSFKEIIGISNVSDCAKKCAGAMLMLGESARNNNPDQCVKTGYEYNASVDEKVGILNSLIDLEKEPEWQEFSPKKVIESYLKDPRHEMEFFNRVGKSEVNNLLVSLLGIDTVSDIFMSTTGEALKQRTVNQRVNQVETYSLENQQDRVDRTGKPLT